MEIFIGIVLFLIIIGIIVFVFFISKTPNQRKINENEISLSNDSAKNFFPNIQIIENTTLIPSEKNKIIDTDIKKAISIIDNYAPKATLMKHNVKSANKLLNNKRVFFSTTKRGTDKMLKVANSNEVYGIQMKKSKVNKRKLFDKQTKFTKENELIKTCGKDALINAGFNAASMVVGQYYMNEINNKLDTIQSELHGVSSFLDSEYEGKLAQIVSKLQEIIDNKLEILNNNYLKDVRFREILDLEARCTTLLGQANREIQKCIGNKNIDYKQYKENVNKIQTWIVRQQILQKLLLDIGNLRYILSNGTETTKLSYAQYNHFLNQTNTVNVELENWHKMNYEKFGIDIKQQKRKASFFNIRKNTVGIINEEWAYNKLEKDVVNNIINQTKIKKLVPYKKDKQNEPIKIQKYKGEYYNLLDADN